LTIQPILTARFPGRQYMLAPISQSWVVERLTSNLGAITYIGLQGGPKTGTIFVRINYAKY